jgi:hypothetical protein
MRFRCVGEHRTRTNWKRGEYVECLESWLFVLVLTNIPEKSFKSVLKGDRYSAKIEEAIESLRASVEEFEREAVICNSQRLGQVQRVAESTLSTIRNIDAMGRKSEKDVQQLGRGKPTGIVSSSIRRIPFPFRLLLRDVYQICSRVLTTLHQG